MGGLPALGAGDGGVAVKGENIGKGPVPGAQQGRISHRAEHCFIDRSAAVHFSVDEFEPFGQVVSAEGEDQNPSQQDCPHYDRDGPGGQGARPRKRPGEH